VEKVLGPGFHLRHLLTPTTTTTTTTIDHLLEAWETPLPPPSIGEVIWGPLFDERNLVLPLPHNVQQEIVGAVGELQVGVGEGIRRRGGGNCGGGCSSSAAAADDDESL